MSKWIELETDASTGKPYLWKCDECGEEVTTRWNYCPECGDPKTSKGKSINTLVKALETEHRKLKEMQSKLGTNLAEVGTDTISRQAAIDALNEYFVRIGKLKRRGLNKGEKAISLDTVGAINSLPPAQTEQHLDEWCTDCKEYDTERHCCPRWNKVIRQTLTIAQPEPCEDAVSRADILSMIDDMADDVNDGFGFAYEQWKEQVEELPPVTPKQRTGKWILDRSGAYCCSECLEPCAGYVMMKPRDKFCKMCGAKMELA